MERFLTNISSVNLSLYWIGYILGVAMLVVGVLVLAGLAMQNLGGEGGEMLRTMFGIVLILYGVYRVALTDMQRRRRRNEE
jgi:uncharacterized membrane protein YkgB